jgi:indole-3-glycerol phosphate synthase
LTEPTFFDGALEHLRPARGTYPPVLRKDFVVDESRWPNRARPGRDAILLTSPP